MNVVRTSSDSNNVLRSARNHVLSRQKTRGCPSIHRMAVQNGSISCICQIELPSQNYLINAGADVSVVPLTTESKNHPPAPLQIFMAKRTTISINGQ
ncbi:hypothetical protein NPIL_147141 [Nephila pilipes]|uniref:Peptidase A2 domain-containing protein n=1 Tax=Nephila pilipes TaxID=299642 RepID=A0A8X6QLC0_NEPPI|nr:hypothetical protein NPIL_147141 [Nephila pilipes]